VARLALARRLSRNDQELLRVVRALPKLQGKAREAAWNFIKSYPLEHVLKAQEKIEKEVPESVRIQDRELKRFYTVTRLPEGLFQVEVDGKERTMGVQELLETLPYQVVLSLPAAWEMEALR
jgi:uncharacterized membrane protein